MDNDQLVPAEYVELLFLSRQQLHLPNVHLLNFSFENSGSYFANSIADAILIQELISEVLELPSMGNIAEQLKVLRRQYGWLQDDLACEPGVSFSTVNRWENGKIKLSRLAQKGIGALAVHAAGDHLIVDGENS